MAEGAPLYIDTELNKGSNDLDVPVGERVTVFVPIETALRDYDLGNEEERELVGMAKFWSTISLLNLFCSNYACIYLEVITARIRRMGEGNVLTRVCPSVCPQGGGVGQQGGRGGSGPAAGGRGGSATGGRGGSAGGRGGSAMGGRGGSARGRGGSVGGGVGQPRGRGEGWVNRAEGWVSHGGRGGSGPGGRYASCVHAGGLSCLDLCVPAGVSMPLNSVFLVFCSTLDTTS